MLARVALFFTGRRHAGEKMAQLPASRRRAGSAHPEVRRAVAQLAEVAAGSALRRRE